MEERRNESFTDQMKSVSSFFVLLFTVLMLAASGRASGPQTSADYNFSVESTDGGGSRVGSADYVNNASFSAGSFVTSADYAQRGGYIGQLNNSPVATNYLADTYTNTTFKVPISALLSTATDADGDAVTFVSVAGTSEHNGAARRIGNWVLYQPPAGFTGSDTLTWVAQDSEGDRTTGAILLQIGVPAPPPDRPTLNLISITFDSAPGATDATLRFASLPGETYVVQYTDSLTEPVKWTTLGTAPTTDGVFQIVDPTARNASQRYYRTYIQYP